MKNISFIAILLLWININSFAQTNTFPSSGNVGIGTTNPTGVLHVYNGQAHFESSASGSSIINNGTYALVVAPLHTRSTTANSYYGGIAFNHLLNYSGSTFFNNSPGAWIGLRQYDLPGSERDYLVFATKSGTGTTGIGNDIPVERMAIDPFGNVGIGTSSPGAKLELGSANTPNITNTLFLGNASISTAWTVGTKLTFGYSSTVSQDDYSARIIGYTNAGVNYASRLFLQTHNATSGVWNTGMILDEKGYVGIGTNSPTERLSVNGNIQAKKLIVTLNGWADYVFSDEYKLRPLNDLENFIKKYKHLPEISSQKEVEENGISVGDNQALLLKKIEELTLYVIEQQKEIAELKKASVAQQKQIADLKRSIK